MQRTDGRTDGLKKTDFFSLQRRESALKQFRDCNITFPGYEDIYVNEKADELTIKKYQIYEIRTFLDVTTVQ